MKKELQELHRAAMELHGRWTRLETWLDKSIKEGADKGDHADDAYALREVAAVLDDVRKKAEAKRKFAERMACLVALTQMSDEPIRTPHCTAKTDVKPVARLPDRRREPEAYAKMMTYLGVPEELWSGDEDHAVVKPHWPGVQEMVAAKLAEGKPLPAGLKTDETFTEYKLHIVKRKGVCE